MPRPKKGTFIFIYIYLLLGYIPDPGRVTFCLAPCRAGLIPMLAISTVIKHSVNSIHRIGRSVHLSETITFM